MKGERVRIEGDAEDLELVRRRILDELGGGSDVHPVSAAVPGELGEPVLAGLVVALTPAVTIRTLGAIIERAIEHRERMEQLRIYREQGNREVAASEIFPGRSPQ